MFGTIVIYTRATPEKIGIKKALEQPSSANNRDPSDEIICTKQNLIWQLSLILLTV